MVLSNWKILRGFLKLRFYLQSCRWGGSEPQGFVNSELGRTVLLSTPQAYEDKRKTSYQIMKEETHVETVTLK